MPIATASTSATIAVPRTYPPSTFTLVTPTRRPRSRRSPRNGRMKNAQIRSPSLRKKNSTTSIRRRPATNSVARETPLSAVWPNSALVRKSTIELRASSTCCSSIGNGSVCTQPSRSSKPSVAAVDELIPLVAHGEHDGGDDAAEHDDAAEEGHPRGEDRREPDATKPAHEWARRRREDECDEHGDDEELDLHERPDGDGADARARAGSGGCGSAQRPRRSFQMGPPAPRRAVSPSDCRRLAGSPASPGSPGSPAATVWRARRKIMRRP